MPVSPPPSAPHDIAVRWVVTWFGTGLLPGAPGTWGSLAALPFAWGLSVAGGPPLLALATVVVFLVGWGCSSLYARRTGLSDPGHVVIDEVAGQWLALIAVAPDAISYAAGFLLFRLFDIVKPWPANWADRSLKGGFGIMLDDIVAGAYAGAALQALQYWRGN